MVPLDPLDPPNLSCIENQENAQDKEYQQVWIYSCIFNEERSQIHLSYSALLLHDKEEIKVNSCIIGK